MIGQLLLGAGGVFAAGAAILVWDVLTRDLGEHAAPRHLGRVVREDPVAERAVPRRPTRSQPPADLFPPLIPVVPPRPDPGLGERLVWSGSADTGCWERVDLGELLAGIVS